MTASSGNRHDDRFAWVQVRSEQDVHQWLTAHHGQDDAIWLVTWKKL